MLTIDNWLTLTSLIFIAFGGGFALWQFSKSTRIKRAEFLNQIIEKLRFDENLKTMMYVVDYNQNWYDADKFHNRKCTEFKICQYEINRVCASVSTKIYLWNLYHFSKKIIQIVLFNT